MGDYSGMRATPTMGEDLFFNQILLGSSDQGMDLKVWIS